jgi:phosphate transport system permease protein
MASEPLAPSASVPSPPRQRLLASAVTAGRRLFADKAARWVVTGGGMTIIASILGILVFILVEVLPLGSKVEVRVGQALPIATEAEGLVVDEYQTHLVALSSSGVVRTVDLAQGKVIDERTLLTSLASEEASATATITAVKVPAGDNALLAATSDGRLLAQTVDFRIDFDANGKRSVHPELPAPFWIDLDPERRPFGTFTAHVSGAEEASAAAQLVDGSLVVLKRTVTRNAFTGATEDSSQRFSLGTVPPLTALALDGDSRNLFGGTAAGEILWWNLDAGDGAVAQRLDSGSGKITAFSFLIGDRSVVVGKENGGLSVWFPVRQGEGPFTLTKIRDFPPMTGAVTLLAASERNRSFLAKDASGGLGLYFSTSERTLWQGRSPIEGASALVFSPKGDGAFVASPTQVGLVEIDNPHPEVSWRALFGKVFYEGYEEPELVWQSTGGTDDFESKISLTPLIVGTLKGTFYSLLLAIPLGVLGAMFASQFLAPRLLTVIKPTVEIMASLPSVVLGFLAGLWLAPILERTFPGLLLMLLLVPLAVWLAGVAWDRVPLATRNRFPAGAEVFGYLVVVGLTLTVCVQLSPGFERLAFGGSFPDWLFQVTGLRYDQRNAVVVGLAMGFAVIPIIFAISEDAFSNVPRNLVAGSLALGANRWQTVTRVVLPTASPGIFSAVMIGFGRAVGETMIVLMATGNTPILDWSAFNGFRTLSANIAVEIPEAPQGGTLYRTLFLAGLILFVLTFVVNTFAELVRQRLRKRYAQL